MKRNITKGILLVCMLFMVVMSVSAKEDTGTINIKDVVSSDVAGDINLDDQLNDTDITILRQYLVDVEIDESCNQTVLLDVNDDDDVNVADLVRERVLMFDLEQE